MASLPEGGDLEDLAYIFEDGGMDLPRIRTVTLMLKILHEVRNPMLSRNYCRIFPSPENYMGLILCLVWVKPDIFTLL